MSALANGVSEVIADHQALILDVGAGTGLVGDMVSNRLCIALSILMSLGAHGIPWPWKLSITVSN